MRDRGDEMARHRPGRRGLVAALVGAAVLAIAGVVATATEAGGLNPYGNVQFAIGLSSVTVGGFICWRRPRHPVGVLLLAAGTGAWASFAGAVGIAWMMRHAPSLEWLSRAFLHLATPGWIVTRGTFIALLPQAYPDGPARGRLSRALWWTAVGSIGLAGLCQSLIFSPAFFAGQAPGPVGQLALDVQPWAVRVMLVTSILSIVGLVVRVAPSEQRRVHLPFAIGIVAMLGPILVDTWNNVVQQTALDLSPYEVWTSAAVPLVLAVGILRWGALDLGVVLRRATVFTLVSVGAAALYGVAVWVVTTVFPDGDRAGPLVGAGLVAVSFAHLRDAVQRLAARRLFGTDDPLRVLRELGRRVEDAPRGDEPLQVVTDLLHDRLHLPYAAVRMVLDGDEVVAARSGTDTGRTAAFPLEHRGIHLGHLVVAPRDADTSGTTELSATDRLVLDDVARQTSVLAHNASLTAALRHSRAVLLNAREEERRRIRADLHDGLGPTLASVALGLDAAADRLADDTELGSLLTELERELHRAIADVRTLVYDLRPAALDDLGLASALREHADALVRRTAESSHPLSVELDLTDVGSLPAAVEVAAYRVALEALTNVARHARASSCRVRLATTDGLELTVEDDGVGFDGAGTGVGTTSMRARVEEVGGRFGIRSRRSGGTTVHAWLPLPTGAPT